MKNIEIAFISDVMYPFTIGGSEYRLYSLRKYFKEKQCNMHFFVGKWWSGPSNYKDLEGVFITRRLYQQNIDSSKSRRALLEPISFTIALAFKILHHNKSYDIIEMNFSPLLHYLLIPLIRKSKMGSKARIIITLHEAWLDKWKEYYGGLESYIGFLIEKYAIKHADHIVTISYYNKSKLIKNGTEGDKISVIRPGIDYWEIQRIKKEDTAEGYDVVFSGRLTKEKGLDILLKAISFIKKKKNKNIKVGIIGEGPIKNELINLSNSLGISQQIVFHGFVSRSSLISILKESKIFVYPLAPEGGWSIAMLEANAAGLPLITSKVSSVGVGWEIVKDGYNGYLTNGTYVDLAEKILLLLEDETTRRKMGENGIIFAKQFDWKKIADETFNLYKKLIFYIPRA
jgi:glycosyltransferase involved in cell wall biosynthesis